MSVPARRTDAQPAHPPSRAPDGPGARRRPADGATRPLRSPAPRTAPAAPARSLTRKRKKHHLGFAILATVLVGGLVLGIVSLNALLAQTSFRIDAIEGRIDELSSRQLQLVHEQATLSAPGRIAAWARRNGMRLPDDIRSLHASGDAQTAPAGADLASGGGT